ncbi:hypothetical protein KL920_003677 [Ogataea angusta]|nr:hypothetical protein KL920_003677 [Ogataea angusta]KAG7857415.1 hypothetical protein KL939_003303 [Ogataea angusta]
MSAPDGSKFKNTEAGPNLARAAASASLLPGRATMCTFSKSSDRRHGNEVCPPSDQTHSSVRNKPKPGYFGGGSYIRQQLRAAIYCEWVPATTKGMRPTQWFLERKAGNPEEVVYGRNELYIKTVPAIGFGNS